MKKYVITICVLLTAGLTGCNDTDYLKEEPTTFYTIDNAFQTKAQVDQTVVSLYAHLRKLIANPSESQASYIWKSNGSDVIDVALGGISTSLTNYNTFTPENGNLKALFDSFYTLISRTNLTIYAANLPQIKWTNEADKAYVLAQARFIRAYCYGNLAELWGGVPLVVEVVNAPKFDYQRESRETIYQYAIDELTTIANDLPETTAAGGRLVRGAAHHYLSEMYLALGNQLEATGKKAEAQNAFKASVDVANKVIDGGIYSLTNARFGKRASEKVISIPVYDKGVYSPNSIIDTIQIATNFYWDMYQEDNVNYQDGNKEAIWTCQIDYQAYKTEDKDSKLNYARIYGQAFRDGSSGNLTGVLEDVGGRGVTGQVPTFYWRDSIWNGKFNSDLRNSEIMIRRRFIGNVPNSEYYKKEVPWSLLYNTSENRGRCFPVSAKISTDRFTGIADGENRSNLFRDEYIFRLAETILIRAEAKQRLGDKNGAASDINLLRDRAQCTYRVTAADMDDNFNMILDERCRELMYEEHRWNTLLRMGGTTANDRIRKYCIWEDHVNTMTRKFNLFPIPQGIIDANVEVRLEQNSGW